MNARIAIWILESFQEDEFPAETTKTIEVLTDEWKARPFDDTLFMWIDLLSACHILAELGLLEYQFTHAWCRTRRGTEELARLKQEVRNERA